MLEPKWHDNYYFLLECGCEDRSGSLGIQRMPDGYALMLNADRDFYFWVEKATGRESAYHWDKWAVYRWAKARAADTTIRANRR